MLQELSLSAADPISLLSLLLNLGVGVVLSLLLAWHFRSFGSTLSNREEFSLVLPFVLLTTVLIITIVKSSLALSLGLVGALSVVRFRTPIKEPEELAYLFIAIGTGLGLGANQTLTTAVAVTCILGIMGLLNWARRDRENKNLYLSLEWTTAESDVPAPLHHVNRLLPTHSAVPPLPRYRRGLRNGSSLGGGASFIKASSR